MAKLHRRVRNIPYSHVILAFLGSVLLTATASAQAAEALPEDAPEVARLRALAAQLGSEDGGQRQVAFEAITTLDQDDLPAIRARIERLRRGRPPRNWAVDVMNRFRRRAPTEGDSPDLAAGAMEELRQVHVVPQERARVLLMAEPALLWRALDSMGTVAAQRAAFPLIGLDEGLWMPEARNWLRTRGPALMAATMHARSDPDRFARRWGTWGMETLHADDPGQAIHTLDESQLPDVLRAYASLRIQSAMRVIVSHVDSERRAIRVAARWAMAQYEGNGIWVLRAAYRNELGEHPPEELGWRGVTEALYAHVDARRMEPVRTALQEGLAARDAGDLSTMRERFDAVLARLPELEEPGPVAEGYATLAAHHAEGQRWSQAVWAYRRALRLDPDHASAASWRTESAFATARRDADRGVWDERAFERIVAASPSHQGARAALALLAPPEARAAAPTSASARWGIAAALLLMLMGLGLLWRGPDRHGREATVDTTMGDTLDETADTTLSDPTLSG